MPTWIDDNLGRIYTVIRNNELKIKDNHHKTLQRVRKFECIPVHEFIIGSFVYSAQVGKLWNEDVADELKRRNRWKEIVGVV